MNGSLEGVRASCGKRGHNERPLLSVGEERHLEEDLA